MIPFILLGAALAGGAIVLAVFWKEIVSWVKRVMDRLPDSVKKNLEGVTAFVEKLKGVVKNIMNYYSYDQKTEKWTETVVSREVDPSQIPKNIREQMERRSKVDISDEFQEKLELTRT